MHIHFDQATPFLQIYPSAILALLYKEMYRMFITALSVKAKDWGKKWPLIRGLINYILIMEYYVVI